MSRDSVLTLLNLLGELEGQLDGNHDPQLSELRLTVGAALAALHRANAEARLVAVAESAGATRH